MKPTGRTVTVCIRVSPELKNKINLIQESKNLNISEWFENSFNEDFEVDTKFLENEKKKFAEKIISIDKKLNQIKIKEQDKLRLELSKEEIEQLVAACSHNELPRRQHGIFCAMIKKKFTFEEFKDLKKKYVYQG